MHSVVLILLFIFGSALPIDRLPATMSVKFDRKVIQNNSTEIIRGTAYYTAPHKVFLEVDVPVRQIMIIDREIMTIYYPLEKKAFRIKSKVPIPMPFVSAILSAMKDDCGLSEMGYTLKKHEKKGDVLYSYWKPPREHRKQLGEFILGMSDRMVVYAETKSPDGETSAKSFYQKHMRFDGRYLPLEVRSEIRQGENLIEEHVTYADVKFNVSLPAEIANFKLPESIPVKEVEW